MAEPPYYILIAHSTLQHSSQCNSLVHADIEYRYADDSPLSLLPRYPGEHVLVFNHDPSNATKPAIASTSSQLALSGVKVLPAPGAGADEDANKNDNMYILEVTSTSEDHSTTGLELSQAQLQNPLAIVARFKQRNADLRRILEYPQEPNLHNQHPFSPSPHSHS